MPRKRISLASVKAWLIDCFSDSQGVFSKRYTCLLLSAARGTAKEKWHTFLISLKVPPSVDNAHGLFWLFTKNGVQPVEACRRMETVCKVFRSGQFQLACRLDCPRQKSCHGKRLSCTRTGTPQLPGPQKVWGRHRRALLSLIRANTGWSSPKVDHRASRPLQSFTQ